MSDCTHNPQTENDHPILLHAILSFYERTANLPIAFRLPFVVPPSFSLFKRMLIRGDGLSVSRGAGIIALYKDAFESVKKYDYMHELLFPLLSSSPPSFVVSLSPLASVTSSRSVFSPSSYQSERKCRYCYRSTVRLNFPNGMNRIKDEFNPTILIFCTALWRKLFQGNKGDSFDLPM